MIGEWNPKITLTLTGYWSLLSTKDKLILIAKLIVLFPIALILGPFFFYHDLIESLLTYSIDKGEKL